MQNQSSGGNALPLTHAQGETMEPETLYLENRRLLYHLARQYLPVLETRGDVDLDDLTQAGFFGLTEAEKTWRSQGGKSWAGWAAWYARREMEKALGVRRTAGNKRAFPAPPLSLDEPLSNDAETARGDLIPDTRLSDHTDVLFAQGLQAAVRAAVDTLPEDERAVLRARYFQGLAAAKTAVLLGLSALQVRVREERALGRLRRMREMRLLWQEIWRPKVSGYSVSAERAALLRWRNPERPENEIREEISRDLRQRQEQEEARQAQQRAAREQRWQRIMAWLEESEQKEGLT